MSTTADSGNTRPAGATPLPLVSLFPCSRSWGQSPSLHSLTVPSEAPGSSVPRRTILQQHTEPSAFSIAPQLPGQFLASR